MSDADDDDEPLTLGSDALLALQSVLSPSGGTGDDTTLIQLLQARRMEDDTDDDDSSNNNYEDDGGLSSGESHLEYYKKLYPERYGTSETGGLEEGDGKLVAIVSMDDEYIRKLILTAFEKRPKWKVLTEVPTHVDTVVENSNNRETTNLEYHFHWGEYEHIDWFSDSFTAEKRIVSCYYNRKGLIRKGHLAHILEKWYAKYKDTKIRVAPKSYILKLPVSEEDELNNRRECETNNDISHVFLNEFHQTLKESGFQGFGHDGHDDDCIISNENEELLQFSTKVDDNHNDEEVWILKPSVTNQANGICLVTSQKELLNAIYRADPLQRAGDFVLQQYISPLLLDGRKFHLRVFMLLHGNLTAYVSSDFLAIFSLEQYKGASFDNTRAHLTNIAHQEVLSINDQHKCMRLFDETKQDMVESLLEVGNIEEATSKVQEVKSRVYEIISETIEAVSCELTFTSKKNCFEMFGLDFMIDPSWNIWLLEANAEPDLSKAGERLQPVIDKLLIEALEIVVDQNIEEEKSSFVKVFERLGRSY